ncbi:MAG: DNA-binding protein [Burkholderiales bacterium]|nr:MAG: DNA-binding protein [Burkholderiales bacterium]
MSVESFLDTNVFVYQLERSDARKADIAERLIAEGIAQSSACISYHVVQELLNIVLRKARVKLAPDDARRYLQGVLAPLYQVQPSLRLYHAALDLHARYRFGFHDSLIVAAALEAGCKRLYSEDLQDGQNIGGLTIVNPFARRSPELRKAKSRRKP